MNRSCEHLITLVGANPLPAYLSVRALKPKKVTLVYSPQTKEPKRRLASVLEREGMRPDDDLDYQRIDDAADEIEVRTKLNAVLQRDPNASLDYTGGTKVMSTGARLALDDKAEDPYVQGFWWDGRKGRIRFCSGASQDARTLIEGVSLSDVLALHDAQLDQAREIPAMHDVLLAAREELGSKAATKRSGAWLEDLTAVLVRQACDQSGITAEIFVGAHVSRPGEGAVEEGSSEATARAPEFDVIAMIEHRLHLIECAADRPELADKKSTARRGEARLKAKLFTVSSRSRQLGGDLARAALVTRRPTAFDGSPAVNDLQAMADDHWESPNPVTVFGIDDLHTWIGAPDHPSDPSHHPSRLRTWLELT